jgi:hypothetical protein
MATRTVSVSSYELRDMNNNLSATGTVADLEENETQNDGIEVRALPPIDHGRAAYIVLLACTVLQAPIWGTTLISQLQIPFFEKIELIC